jgi:hypothetical protein
MHSGNSVLFGMSELVGVKRFSAAGAVIRECLLRKFIEFLDRACKGSIPQPRVGFDRSNQVFGDKILFIFGQFRGPFKRLL